MRLDVEHVVDANVGLHFAHVDRLDLLVDHFGDHLVVVEHVHQEWVSQRTRPIRPLEPGHTQQDREARERRKLVKAAASRLVILTKILDEDGQYREHYSCALGEPMELDQELVGKLRATRQAMMERFDQDPDDEHPESNYGECACVLYLRRDCGAGDCAVGVLLTNDSRAHEYARHRGIRRRTTREILDQIVDEGRLGLDAAAADALYERMLAVSQVSERLR